METTKPNQSKELAAQNWQRELDAQLAGEVGRAPTIGDRWLKTKNKNFELGDLSATEIKVVVLNWVFENVYYANAYNPAATTAPICWALGDNELDLAPDDSVPARQSETGCSNCWANEPRRASGQALPEQHQSGTAGCAAG
jgi:hypothetical protein